MRRLVSRTKQGWEGLERLALYIAASTLVLMAVLTTLDVIGRRLRKPVPMALEVSEMMLVAATFLPIALLQARKGHLSVDLLTGRLPRKIVPALHIVWNLLALLVFTVVLWRSGGYAWQAWVTKEYRLGQLIIPLWPAKAVLSLGVGMLCVRLVINIVEDFAGLWRHKPGGPQPPG